MLTGGQHQFREEWPRYCKGVDCIIFVVDTSDVRFIGFSYSLISSFYFLHRVILIFVVYITPFSTLFCFSPRYILRLPIRPARKGANRKEGAASVARASRTRAHAAADSRQQVRLRQDQAGRHGSAYATSCFVNVLTINHASFLLTFSASFARLIPCALF